MSGVSIGTLVREAAVTLAAAGIDSAGVDARRLAAHAFNLDRLGLERAWNEPAPQSAAADFGGIIARRLKREPVSRIVGARFFFGRRFAIDGAVLDPRPETETVVEAALGLLHDRECPRILEVGVGSGCIIVTMLCERPDATAVATDR